MLGRSFASQRTLEVSELVAQDDVLLLQTHGHFTHLFLRFSGLIDLESFTVRSKVQRA